MTRRLLNVTAALGLAAVFVSAPARGEEISVEDLQGLPDADVVILGEIHDNPDHHLNQAEAIAAIAPKALVFEMLDPGQALNVRADLLGDAAALSEALVWDNSGWPDFDMYYPIFEASTDMAIFGGAMDRDRVRRAVTEGSAAVMGDAAALFGLDDALDDAMQNQREAMQMAAHCDALPVDMVYGMVEAQRLRDAALAQAVIAAVAETGGPVAVITGNGHARLDWGIPSVLTLAAPDLSVLSIAQFEAAPEGEVPYDLWLLTDPAERGDPCEAFK